MSVNCPPEDGNPAGDVPTKLLDLTFLPLVGCDSLREHRDAPEGGILEMFTTLRRSRRRGTPSGGASASIAPRLSNATRRP